MLSASEPSRIGGSLHLERPGFWLAGNRYRMLGRLAEGEASDVFLGLRDHRLTERVIVKVLRAHEDRDLFESEWRTLTELQRSTAEGSAHFTRLLPQPVAHGEGRLGVHGDEGRRLGGDPRVAPKTTPRSLAQLLETCAAPDAGGVTSAHRRRQRGLRAAAVRIVRDARVEHRNQLRNER